MDFTDRSTWMLGVVLEAEARRRTIPAADKHLGETPGAAAGPAPTVPMRLAQDKVEVGLCTKQDAGVIAEQISQTEMND
jgi:hypothetical protein